MHHNLAGNRSGCAFFRGQACEKWNAIHEVKQPVIIAGDETLRKDGQRKLCLGENAGSAFKRFPVKPLAIDAESADTRQQEGLHSILHEEMPTGHHMERLVHLARQQSQDQGITWPAMIGGQQDTGSRFQGRD
jgi:hypothetical protein